MKDIFRRNESIRKSERSEPELEPYLIEFRCPYGDWSVVPTKVPYHKALELFGKHNIDAHGGEPNLHLTRVYDMALARQKL